MALRLHKEPCEVVADSCEPVASEGRSGAKAWSAALALQTSVGLTSLGHAKQLAGQVESIKICRHDDPLMR